MSLALGYGMKKRMGLSHVRMPRAHFRHFAEGGEAQESKCAAHGAYPCKMCHGGKMMADGGESYPGYGYEDDDDSEGGEVEKDKVEGMIDKILGRHDDEYEEDEGEDGEDDEDIIARILSKHYSEGGQVANDTSPEADSKPNEFDDLVLRDDLEDHYTGENSGDELGNEELDSEDEDIISRIMRSRMKKDRNPSVA